MQWLADKGLKWEKVCMEPGDLVVWDSRTPHYNVSPSPSSTQVRLATYTCYMPVADATQEDLIRKKQAFEELKSTTHWPNAMHVGKLRRSLSFIIKLLTSFQAAYPSSASTASFARTTSTSLEVGSRS